MKTFKTYWKRRRIYGSVLLLLVIFISCTHSPSETSDAAENEPDCMARIVEKIRSAPVKRRIATLDGQRVEVKEFLEYCNHHFPACILYEKFYYWKSETGNMVSQTSSGRVTHPVRLYYNPYSVCFPSKVDPRRTHGDVVEFYDKSGKFMGIAVHMGEGKYFSIPFSGYAKQVE